MTMLYLAIMFIITVLPMVVVMMGIVLYTDARAKEANTDTSNEIWNRA